MKPSRSNLFLSHVAAGVTQVALRPPFLGAVLAGMGVLAVQSHAAWQAWQHAEEVAWAGPISTLLTTVAALLLLWAQRGDGADPESTSLFSVARGLATGYYFNFLRPLLGSLRQAGVDAAPTRLPFTVELDHQPLDRLPVLHGVVVAIPCQLESVCATPAAGAQQIAERCSDLQLHTVWFNDPAWSRPIELRLVRQTEDGPAVLLDVPTTLNVIHETRSRQRGPRGERSPVEQASDLFVQVLNEFRDVVAQVGGSDPQRNRSRLQVHVVPAEVAEHRIRELLSSKG